LVETYGVPLDVVVSTLIEQGHQPDWIGFYEETVKHNWKPKGVLLRLEGVAEELLGPEELLEWQLRMRVYLKNRAVWCGKLETQTWNIPTASSLRTRRILGKTSPYTSSRCALPD